MAVNSGLRTLVPCYRESAAVTKSDETVFAVTGGLYVGSTGTVTVRMAASATLVAFAINTAGTILPIAIDKVMATDTDAGDFVALY